jgi:hypothetical protein
MASEMQTLRTPLKSISLNNTKTVRVSQADSGNNGNDGYRSVAAAVAQI